MCACGQEEGGRGTDGASSDLPRFEAASWVKGGDAGRAVPDGGWACDARVEARVCDEASRGFKPRGPDAWAMAARKAAKKAAAKEGARKPTRKSAKKPVKKAAKKAARIAGGPRADKAEGVAPVRAYIARQRPEHRAILNEVESIVREVAPEAKHAVKWGAPFWGMQGRGWFLSAASFKNYVKLNFFSGVKLRPPLPIVGTAEHMRAVHYASRDEVDRTQLASWIEQAAALPGWGK